MATRYGDGSLYQRGRIYYFQYFENGKSRQISTREERLDKAKKFRNQYLGRILRGELNTKADKVTCGELLDDVLRHVEENAKPSTAKIWKLVVEANLRSFFGHLRAATLSSDRMREYRDKRNGEGRSDATVNRELSILRTAFHQGRKSTPPKVQNIPFFPLVSESGNARQGFLTDEQYSKLRDALPDYLKPLFVTAYFTGVRLGELLAWRWDQVDWEQGFVTLYAEETKSGHARVVPILAGEMHDWLQFALKESNECLHVFNKLGAPIKEFRSAWRNACKTAEVPDLKFHDLRRTAVRNMRRAGVSQVIRMRITGHRTDSMERRYNIVDVDDIRSAKELMETSRRP
jgi:integrase